MFLVNWKKFVTTESENSAVGCRPGFEDIFPVRISNNSRNSVLPSLSSSVTWGNTSSSALGPGTAFGRRSSLSSMSLELRMRFGNLKTRLTRLWKTLREKVLFVKPLRLRTLFSCRRRTIWCLPLSLLKEMPLTLWTSKLSLPNRRLTWEPKSM